MAYSFPIVKDKEMLNVLTDLFPALCISEQDIHQCKSDIVARIYRCFMSDLGIMNESHNGVPFQCMGDGEDRALEHIHLLAPLFYKLRYVFLRINVEDFCFTDLTQPDPKKTRRLFSALLNLRSFVLDREEIFAELVKEKDERRALYQKRKQLIIEKKSQLNDLKAKKAEYEMKEAEWDRSFELIKEKLDKEVQYKIELSNIRANLKKKVVEIETKQEENSKQLSSLESEKARLAVQLVTSPQRVIAGRRDADRRLQEVKEELENKGRVNEERRKDIAGLQRQTQVEKEKLGLVKDICDLTDNKRQLEESLQKVQASVKSLQNECDDQITSVRRKTEQVAAEEENMVVVSMRNKQQLVERQAEWTEKQNYLHNLKMKQKQSSKVHEGFSKTIEELEQQYEQAEKVQARKVQDVITTVSKTMEELQLKQQKKRESYEKQTEILTAAPDLLGQMIEMVKKDGTSN